MLEEVYANGLGCFPEMSRDRAWLLHELAHARLAMGCNAEAEAEALFEQALGIIKTALGEAHPDYAATLHELARVRQVMGRSVEAEMIYEQALEINKAALGEAHLGTILTLASLAGCRACIGHIDAARGMFESAMARAEALPEGATLWTGRVRLRWAHGLFGASLRKEAETDVTAGRNLPKSAV
ncbi:MAG: tetratricopeptide repeat protein [Alteraurantiacibacter sp.]